MSDRDPDPVAVGMTTALVKGVDRELRSTIDREVFFGKLDTLINTSFELPPGVTLGDIMSRPAK